MNCLVCGNEKDHGKHVCKMCGMTFMEGIVDRGYLFCSEKCRGFFMVIAKESPEMARRNIVI